MIVVGIDSSKSDMGRTNEMLPESPYYVERFVEFEDKKLAGYGSIIGEYIFNELKPMIDGTFFTLSNFADVAYEKHWNGRAKQIHIKEHQLLTKTFRALGWFDE